MSSSRTESPDLVQRAACTELRSVGVSGWSEALAYEGRSYITPFAMPTLFQFDHVRDDAEESYRLGVEMCSGQARLWCLGRH